MKYPIAALIIPPRRREEMGDLAGLAKSIDRYGLMHPIVIDENGNLIAGLRRLEACKRLGWTEIEATMQGELTADDRERMELEENVKRKDLTTAEMAKNMKALAQKIEQELTNKTSPMTGEVSTRGRRGPAKQQDSQQAIADAMAIPQQTLSRNLAYADALERYPALEKPGIPQHQALIMAKTLDALPDDARAQKVQALEQSQKNILADLAGLPPIPDEPMPPDYQKAWSHGFKALRQGIRELSDEETLQGMLQIWSQKTLSQQLDYLTTAIAHLSHIRQSIEESVIHATTSDESALKP